MEPNLFIDGEAGTTGLGIRARLQKLPVGINSIAHELRRDPQARLERMGSADLVVLCLPDEAARDATALAASLPTPPRLLDASSAHRTHADWTYGFPELAAGQPEAIARAARVSNPGCYATGAIALLRPLVASGLIPPEHPISINATSGYSGGGRGMIEAHDAQDGPAFELYGLALEHKHVPEILAHAALSARPIFVPSVGHFRQGMVVSIPLHLDRLGTGATAQRLQACLADWYAGSTSVRVAEPTASLDAAALAERDDMELRVHAHPAYGHVLLTARLDNLGKGASGAAIQNIRLMLGLPG